MDESFNLFCFPYAGGSTTIFNDWKKYIDNAINLKPIELSGRGKRIHDPHYLTTKECVEDIFSIIKDEINTKPYAFFGHSMGAMIANELALKIREEELSEPVHIFFSGRAVPHIKMKEEKKYHLLGEQKFKDKVLELGGTPPDFFKHPELLEFFLPLLRNDFRLAATDFSYRQITPHPCDISVFVGKEEDKTSEQITDWKLHTTGICNIHYFNGGHFFLNDEAVAMVRLINKTLLENNCTLEKI